MDALIYYKLFVGTCVIVGLGCIIGALVDLDHLPLIWGITGDGRPAHSTLFAIGCLGIALSGGYIGYKIWVAVVKHEH